ncbi:hypothetical protein XENOCAPTIV_010171 [Xenoophorus captivus]|uniref:Uncharacterized protein n=1 Tax=Xenoophorus captivus TaxID=1517983 RepID=A0ABV0RGM5_9TELE
MILLAAGSWNSMSERSQSQLISSHFLFDAVLFNRNCNFVKLTRAGRWRQGRGLKATVKTISSRFKSLHRKVAENVTFPQFLSGLNKLKPFYCSAGISSIDMVSRFFNARFLYVCLFIFPLLASMPFLFHAYCWKFCL